MDPSRVFLVVCITLFIVVGINAAIYVSFTRKNTIGQIELMRRAADRARDPWGPEDANLKELSRLVAELKDPDEDPNARQADER
jgi:hypothetical protein